MKKVVVNDKMQKGYVYYLEKRTGKDFHPGFKPELSPKQMLQLGIFCGKYMTDSKNEFLKSWFQKTKLSPEKKIVI